MSLFSKIYGLLKALENDTNAADKRLIVFTVPLADFSATPLSDFDSDATLIGVQRALPVNLDASGAPEEIRLGVTGDVKYDTLTMTAGAWTVGTNDADHVVDLGGAVGKSVMFYNPSATNTIWFTTSTNTLDATELTAMDTALGLAAGGTPTAGAFPVFPQQWALGGTIAAELGAEPAAPFTGFAIQGTDGDIGHFFWKE